VLYKLLWLFEEMRCIGYIGTIEFYIYNHILMMIMVRVWPMRLIHTPEGRWSTIWGLYCIWRQMKYYLRFVLYLKEVKFIDKCSMPYTLHDSFASKVLSWPMVWQYRYNLASYVARGGVRCSFIPLEVWRQRTYAFIEVIFADDVVLYP
jgi:hypothetical protein